MPTGPDFRSAATKMRTEASIADQTQRDVQSANNAATWYEGPYLVSINQVMDASIINLGVVAAEARRLGIEYDRRGEVCDEYTAAMVQWRLDIDAWEVRNTDYWNNYYNATVTVDLPGLKPVEPTRWPLWVEEDRS